MAIETKSKVIGRSEYSVESHGAIKGRALLLRLVKVVGSSLTGIDKANLADALGKLVSSLGEDDLTFFCDAFASKTMVGTPDGGAVLLSRVFDVHFSGEYLELCEWLSWCIEVNFSSFFRDAAAKLVKSAAVSKTPEATAKA